MSGQQTGSDELDRIFEGAQVIQVIQDVQSVESVNVCYPWICTDTFGSLHNLVLTPPKLVKYRLNNNNITMLQFYRFYGGKFVPALNRKSLQNRAAWPRVAFTTCHRSTVCVGVDPRGSV